MRLMPPLGAVSSTHLDPTGGGPRGVVLSPFLGMLHIKRAVSATKTELYNGAIWSPDCWAEIIQIFADDASAAVSRKDRKVLIQLALVIEKLGDL